MLMWLLVSIDISIPSDRWRSLLEVISPKNHPWIANIGIFPDAPTLDDFLAKINTDRNEIDTTKNHS
jgi:hypothetical protein